MPATRTPRTTTTPAPAAVNGTRNAPAPATAAPGPDTGRGGPGSRQRVLTALAGRPQGATVAELAAITGLGTSTVGKALTAAETDGKVTRVPGGRDGARRAPDTWTLPTTAAQPTAEPTTKTPAATTITADTASAATPAAAPEPAAADSNPGAVPASGVSGAAPGLTPGGSRLGKGQLADLTLAWLREHPGEHTASAVGKATGRSSGAIANALAKMTDTGTVRLVSDHPRRYTATPA